jgi:hypothetical protein
VVAPDGLITVAGVAEVAENGDMAVVRYRPDGLLDPTFGSGGKLLADFFGAFDSGLAIALQPDGRVVAGGSALNVTTPEQSMIRIVG